MYMPFNLERVFQSKDFLVQVFAKVHGATRLTICRTERRGRDWVAGISWEELQEIKRRCGFGDACAVELFPADVDVVNVSNMRHLWVLDETPAFTWRKTAESDA